MICPQHGGRLYCGWCALAFGGTDDELAELEQLREVIDPPPPTERRTDATCASCGSGLYCDRCFDAAGETTEGLGESYTIEELTRYRQLLRHILPLD